MSETGAARDVLARPHPKKESLSPVPSFLVPLPSPRGAAGLFLAFDKPFGRPCHGPGSFLSDVRSVHGGEWTLAHRLDRDTSGVLLLARGDEALRLAHAAWGASVTKVYAAIVRGAPPGDEGVVDAPLVENRTERPDRLRRGLAAAYGPARTGLLLAGRPVPGVPPIPPPGRSAVHPAGRAASTRWRVLARRAEGTLLEVEPMQGRMHQIRVHLAHVGCPILGDRLYDRRRTPLDAAPFLRAIRLTWSRPPGPEAPPEWRWEVPVFPSGAPEG